MLPEVRLILESYSTTLDWTSKEGGISTDRNWVAENKIELLFPTLKLKLKLKLTYSFDCHFDSQALALAGVLK